MVWLMCCCKTAPAQIVARLTTCRRNAGRADETVEFPPRFDEQLPSRALQRYWFTPQRETCMLGRERSILGVCKSFAPTLDKALL